MDLQEAMKISIQKYFDGEDAMPDGRKYTKPYLDNFHKQVTGPEVKNKSDKKAEKDMPAMVPDA